MQLQPSSNTDPAPPQLHILSNGLKLVYKHLPNSPVTVSDVWVKAGAIKQPPNWQGIAHFLEHMIFKGSQLIGPSVFDRVIEENGGATNASTSYDYAHFFLTVANEYQNATLPLLAEIMLHAQIDEQEFYREREVILDELRGCYDDPDFIAFELLSQSIYQLHPYKDSIIGSEELLYQHTVQKLRCFHQTHYQPKNMTVVIVGGLKQDHALTLVEDMFRDFCTPSECPHFEVEAEPPLVSIRRQEIELPRITQARLLMGWLGPGVQNIEDSLALDLISIILASSRSSRLVKTLREQRQLVSDIASHFSLQSDSGLFCVGAYLNTENLESVEKSIIQEITQLQTNLVDTEELLRAQKLLSHSFLFSLESPQQLAGFYGYYSTIASLEVALTLPAKIRQLTRENLQIIAQKYLSVERYAVTIIKPTFD